MNGKRIDTDGDVREQLALFEPGQNVTFDVIRYGERKQIRARLGEFDAPAPAPVSAVTNEEDAGSKLGFDVIPLTPQIARQISTTTTSGLVISNVEPASPADHAELRRGYLLKSVNGRPVSTVGEVQAIARTLKAGQPVSLMLATPDGAARILNYQVRM